METYRISNNIHCNPAADVKADVPDRRRLLDISARYSISALVRIFRLISKQASLDKRNLTTINYPFSKDFVREFFKDLSNITFVYHIKNISKPFFILYHNRLIQQ